MTAARPRGRRRLALLAILAAAFVAWQAGVFEGGGAPGPAQPGAAELVRGNGSEPDSLDPQLARMSYNFV